MAKSKSKSEKDTKNKSEKDTKNKSEKDTKNKSICGIIMPISAIDGCNEAHWLDVRDILKDAIEVAGFEANIVSDADDVGIIQKRIIQNVYNNPIIVCDVSGKNPNVMFELGLRLAFDKPTIIIKDDKTSYSFDTSPIEHLEYPRDLRYSKILEFKEDLIEKIKGTIDKSNKDPNFSTFLKHFGTFKVAKLDTKEVSKEEYIFDELKALRNLIISQTTQENPFKKINRITRPYICVRDITKEQFEIILRELKKISSIELMSWEQIKEGHYHFLCKPDNPKLRNEISKNIKMIIPNVKIMAQ
jgi:hypothetical protein